MNGEKIKLRRVGAQRVRKKAELLKREEELRRTAVERVKRVSEQLKRGDVGGAIEFVDKIQYDRTLYDLFGREGCARTDHMNRRDLGLCMGCKNFDRFNFICRVGHLGG